MKYPKVYNYGKIVDTDENLKAYARYFKRYIEEYGKENIPVSMIHVQNEIIADQKFPSCVWSAQMLEKFICNYLYPEIGELAEIWFGTINAPETITTRYNDLLNRCMQNPKFKKAVRGTGLQWAGKFAVQQVHDDYPDLKIYQTESECGDGENSWEYAKYIFEMIRHYFRNGALAYVYWNMILGDSESTWGWKQNSMVTVKNGEIIYNPEFYLMKHFSHFVKKGAVLVKTSGSWSSNFVVFRNPNGEYVVVTMNPFDMERTIKIKDRYVTLEANSFATIML